MREIEFRAVYKGELLSRVFQPFNFYDMVTGKMRNEDEAEYFDDSVIFEQYTGLRDKNGKKIFEGDIVEDGFGELRTVKWFNDLGYDGGGATHSGFYYDNTYDGHGELSYHNSMTECTVIGNVHENPELLEVEK